MVSGPEKLVLPALAAASWPAWVIFLCEARRGEAGRAPARFAEKLGLSVEEIDVRGRLDPVAVHRLAAALSQLRPAIAHAHDVKASTYLLAASRLIPRSIRPALVSTHHGIHGRPDKKTRLYESFYVRAILPGFDRVLAVSAADRAELARRGLRDERVVLHLNGIDARRVDPLARAEEQRRIRAAWGLPDDGALILGVVARLSAEKRIDRALDLAFALARRDPALAFQLVIFGDGAQASVLKRRAAGLGLDHGRARFMGFRATVGDELAGLDLLLSMSDAEGLPINLIEAGWAGTPVAATAVGGVHDLLGAPPAGLLLDPRDPPEAMAEPVHALLLDAPRRDALGWALQSRVEKTFSRRAWLARLGDIYAPLLDPASLAASSLI